MEKRKKVIRKKCGLVLLVLILLYILGTIMFVSILPKMYLAHKYDTKMSDYKVADYYPGYFAYDIDYWAVVWHDSQLVYEAKKDGREFVVEFMNFQYYDAYQMKEVSKWITEELQNNIDNNIDIVNIGAGSVYGIYDKEKDKYKNVVWTKNNVNEIIKNDRIGEIYIRTDDIEQYLDDPNVSKSTTYYNSNNTNLKFEEYISDFSERFYNLYKVKNITIYLHKTKLPMYSGYSLYGVDQNELTDEQENYMIVAERYDENY